MIGNADNVLEAAPLALRAFTGGAAALFGISGLVNLLWPRFYTTAVVGLLIFLESAVIFLSEFSPLGLHSLMKFFPFLGEYRGRGIFYVIAGVMSLGREMRVLGQVAGSLVAISGLGSIALQYLMPATPPELGFEDVSNPNAFQRYEDHEVDLGMHAGGDF